MLCPQAIHELNGWSKASKWPSLLRISSMFEVQWQVLNLSSVHFALTYTTSFHSLTIICSSSYSTIKGSRDSCYERGDTSWCSMSLNQSTRTDMNKFAEDIIPRASVPRTDEFQVEIILPNCCLRDEKRLKKKKGRKATMYYRRGRLYIPPMIKG